MGGNNEEDNILPFCITCGEPILRYDPEHYAPSFDSDFSQATIKALKEGFLGPTLATLTPEAVPGNAVPLTIDNMKTYDKACGVDSTAQWVNSIRVFGLDHGPTMQSIKKGRGSSIANITESDGSFVLVDTTPVDNLLFGVGDWSDQTYRVEFGYDAFVCLDMEGDSHYFLRK